MELEQIEGTVEDIIYENPDNGYTVFEISGGGTVTVVCGACQCDMLPPLKSLILKWGLLAQWLY